MGGSFFSWLLGRIGALLYGGFLDEQFLAFWLSAYMSILHMFQPHLTPLQTPRISQISQEHCFLLLGNGTGTQYVCARNFVSKFVRDNG